jgi:hypothetical protein
MIVACCTDLIFATKIRSTAAHLGIPFRPANSKAAIADRLHRVSDGKLNEPVTGVLVDLDMGETALAVIEEVKGHWPGVTVVAFGSHVAVEVLQAARERGCDVVMPRSQFTAKLPELLTKYGGAEL